MITFDSPEVQLRKFRERLQKMSDQELIGFGRALGRIPERVLQTRSMNWKKPGRNGEDGIRLRADSP